ncbi:MAG: hypothetical protein PHC54_06745 [Candidatus Omnitrophica bacterium]|nr:hypothetical protein [Candidatus Omnitrophota bacterium]MDD5593066.1 hypothetical protein [Candidatus Omnitrophota bacterium]
MYKKVLLKVFALTVFSLCVIAVSGQQAFAQKAALEQPVIKEQAARQEGLPKEKVLEIATAAVKAKGMDLTEAVVVYDDGDKLWIERIGAMTMPDESPNHGIMKKGFLKNYETVFFDFKEPVNDVWVFIDKDTGEVFEVYQEQ